MMWLPVTWAVPVNWFRSVSLNHVLSAALPERSRLTRTSAGQPTYFVATLVVLLRSGSKLPDITGVGDLRDAISQLAGDVTVEDNLIAAEVLWTPEDDNDTMDREDMFMNFPELVSV